MCTRSGKLGERSYVTVTMYVDVAYNQGAVAYGNVLRDAGFQEQILRDSGTPSKTLWI